MAANPIRSIERESTGENFVFATGHDLWKLVGLANRLKEIQCGQVEDVDRWLWEVQPSLLALENGIEATTSSGLRRWIPSLGFSTLR